MERNYIIAGFGGQGVLFAGKLLANVFMLSDKNVTWYPCYGAEMRGGTVNCEIVVSDNEVSSVHKQEVDCLVALNQLSLNKFSSKVKSGGCIVYNSSLAEPEIARKDIEYIASPISELALEIGSPKFANMIALAVLSNYEKMLTDDMCRKALSLMLPSDKLTLLEANLHAFESTKSKILVPNFN
ncbi:2-oxoacid:acceptor oxidoreductase family protein [bacterium]|nr:2-oxoacid:acceptor oxidoreductase family protein [bacterium]